MQKGGWLVRFILASSQLCDKMQLSVQIIHKRSKRGGIMNKNRFISLLGFFMLYALLLGVAGLAAMEETVPTGLTYAIRSGDTVTITGYTGSESTLVLPGTIEGKPVTAIGNGAFQHNTSLQSLIIPSGVTNIEYSAFEGCSNLGKINIPDTVISIDFRAFKECTSLVKVTLPSAVKTLESRTFDGCTYLISINTGGITSYGSSVFAGCSNLKTVNLANGLTSIPDSLFSGCSNLTSLTIPSSVTSIGSSAFSGCSKLTSLTIPNNVTNIGGGAFYGCRSLTSLELPTSLTSIEAQTFWGCSSLSSIKIPGHVRSIGENAFYDCDGLVSVTVPSSVISIGMWAFVSCDNLRTVTIPISVTSIGSRLFGQNHSNATIRGYPYSTAEKYAKDNNISFEALPIIKVTGIRLSNQGFSLKVYERFQLTVEVSPENATYKAISWSSSNSDIALVTADGQVIGVTNGTATIIATAKDGSEIAASCIVTVTDPEPDVVKGDANGSGTLDLGDIESLIDYLVNGVPCADMDGADADGNGEVELADLIWIVQQLAK